MKEIFIYIFVFLTCFCNLYAQDTKKMILQVINEDTLVPGDSLKISNPEIFYSKKITTDNNLEVNDDTSSTKYSDGRDKYFYLREIPAENLKTVGPPFDPAVNENNPQKEKINENPEKPEE
jgi:hypothetical protein